LPFGFLLSGCYLAGVRVAASLSILAIAAFGSMAKSADAIPAGCRQIVLVIAPRWNSASGILRRFARPGADGSWTPAGDAVPVLLGENGLAWCAGLRAIPDDHAPRKREGDRRSPAGVFSLSSVFCREKLDGVRMPLLMITPTTEAIDDPDSRYYNRIVDRRDIAHPDWRSSERMAEIHDYSLCIAVGANPSSQPGSGSCIFVHLWTGKRSGTAGCTALRPENLLALVRWLDPAQKPVLIQAPEEAAGFLPAPLPF
jgi:L,D-peptidoglycan transpeptidase YkuD (ErfK/YbiS/YcfS/YnhG family)